MIDQRFPEIKISEINDEISAPRRASFTKIERKYHQIFHRIQSDKD